MEPIAKRLRQSAQDALASSTKKKKNVEEDIADRIKQLEAELQAASGSESDSESSDDSGSDSETDRSDSQSKQGNKSKKAAKEPLVLRLSSLESERVQSLPQSSLPRVSCSSKTIDMKQKKRTKDRATGSEPLAWAQEVLALPKKVPFACKPCGFVGKNLEDFQAHCATSEHEEKQATRHQILHCRLCDKQFTSAAQLAEHKQGKWHQSRISKRRERHVVKICYDFLRGSCRRGDHCAFEHTETKAVTSGKALAKKKQLPCRSFSESGKCRFGDKCLYSHSPP